MRYNNTVKGIFVDRPNRFTANVKINNQINTVHVKNTGRCRELLIPGSEVILERADNPDRKTKYDLVAVYSKHAGLVNIDSQAPNKVVKEWLMEKGISLIKPEYSYGKSRLDFYFEKNDSRCLVEVKGVTLIKNGSAYFPDAPTQRGIKHLNELENAVKKGFKCYAAFVIQAEGIDNIYPNMETHPEFGEALKNANNAGVKVLSLGCRVSERELHIDREKEMKDLENPCTDRLERENV